MLRDRGGGRRGGGGGEGGLDLGGIWGVKANGEVCAEFELNL